MLSEVKFPKYEIPEKRVSVCFSCISGKNGSFIKFLPSIYKHTHIKIYDDFKKAQERQINYKSFL